MHRTGNIIFPLGIIQTGPNVSHLFWFKEQSILSSSNQEVFYTCIYLNVPDYQKDSVRTETRERSNTKTTDRNTYVTLSHSFDEARNTEIPSVVADEISAYHYLFSRVMFEFQRISFNCSLGQEQSQPVTLLLTIWKEVLRL